MVFAFISRHTPTDGQIALAAEKGVTLQHIGDADAFTITPDWVKTQGDFEGVVIVHPAAAMRLASTYEVGVFKNSNRAPLGEKPRFEAEALYIYSLR